MFHRQEIAVNNSTGVPIAGVEVRVYDADDNLVSIYSDSAGTPILSVSGVADTAVSDDAGNYSYYVPNGVYTERLYVGDSLAYSIPNLVMQGLVTTIQTPTFADAATITTSSDTNLVIVSGTDAVGDSGTGRTFAYDATVDAAYVAANPTTSFVDGAGRGFKEVVGSSAVGLASDLASTAAGKGAALVGLEQGGTLQNAIRYVTPEMFAGDIQAAADYATANAMALLTGPVDYELTTAFAPHDITWISCDTRIKQMTTSGGVSVLRPQDNVKHIGRTYLWLYDAGSGSADRAHVVFGNWQTGVGFTNFHFDEFVLEGGHEDCNGFSVTGGSSGVRGRRIAAAPASKIGRLFLAHWANFDDHYNSGGTYQHAVGATPTTHPHDIVIDEVQGDLDITGSDYSALWVVSAGYDIHVGKVSGSCANDGAGTGGLVLFTAGDIGLAYASAEELAAGMWGLTVGQVNGSCSHTAVHRIGRALYYDDASSPTGNDSTPQAAEDYFVHIEDTVGEVDAYNTIGNTSYCGVDGHNGYGRSLYNSIKADNFKSAANCSNYTTNFKAGLIDAVNSQNYAIQLTGSGATEADWPTNIDIGTLRVNGTGVGETAAGNSLVSAVNKILGLHIGTLTIGQLKDIAFASPVMTIGADVRGVTIDHVQQNWTAPSGQTIVISNSATGDRYVDVGHVTCPAGLVPVSGGVTSRVRGRNRDYDYFGGTVPSGLTVKVGDRFIANTTSAGQSFEYVVTTAGVTGTDAVVEAVAPRPKTGSATFDPSSLADGAGVTTTVTVTGAALGDYASASFSLDTQGITITAWVSAANTVSVRFQNETGGVLDIGSGTLKAKAITP